MSLSLNDLRELVRYEPETGAIYWLHRDPRWFSGERHRKAWMACWNSRYPGNRADTVLDSKGYPIVRVLGEKFFAHRLAFALIFDRWPERHIDHIDGNRTNNRIANLREVDQGANQRNRGLTRANTSGVVGVSWRERDKRWVATIRNRGRNEFLGHFTTKEAAVAARQAAAERLGFHPNHGMRPAWSARA